MNNHPNTHEPLRLRPAHQDSKMLTKSENQDLYNILGQNGVTLATAVVQILLPEQPHQTRWLKYACGVFCFVKDYDQRTYCFRLYDLKQRRHIFEETVAASLNLQKILPRFFWFDGSNSKVGINFANDNEANLFFEQFLIKQQDRQRKKKSQASTKLHPPTPQIPQQQSQLLTLPLTSTNIVESKTSTNATLTKKSKASLFFDTITRRNKVAKLEISEPSFFEHRGHVDVIANQTFFANDEQAQLFDQYIHGTIEKLMPGITDAEKKEIKEYMDATGGTEQLTTSHQSDAPAIPQRMQIVRTEPSSSVDVRQARTPLTDLFNHPQQAAPDIPSRPGRPSTVTNTSPEKQTVVPNIPLPPPPPSFFSQTNEMTTQSDHVSPSVLNNTRLPSTMNLHSSSFNNQSNSIIPAPPPPSSEKISALTSTTIEATNTRKPESLLSAIQTFDKKRLQRTEQQSKQSVSNLHTTSIAPSSDAHVPPEEDVRQSDEEDWT
ncbi:unnamed protein product [Didymodactylos carnosus]|uniref:WH1 domain-containing protein n=1 Tax=Didymodactylos carnosus TaxID=1234261 RepID=A0A8S2RW25_9BILA|nr:unnamed protein product [Didymodactylos carnosus]CAF4183427.1 unnamed protein product [Didymodactylos carnosus]